MSITVTADTTTTSLIVAFTEGDMSMSEVMGGKGANLAEMTVWGCLSRTGSPSQLSRVASTSPWVGS